MTGAVATQFVTTDPEQAHAFMQQAYCDFDMRVSGDTAHFRMSHTSWTAGHLSTARLDHSLAVEHVAQPLGTLLVGRVLSGHLERDTLGQSGRYDVGDLFLSAEPDQPYTVRWDRVSIAMATVRSDDLTAVLGYDTAPPRFAALEPLSAAAAHGLLTALEAVDATLNNAAAAANPLVSGATARLLAASVLAAFPNDTVEQAPSAMDRRDATSGTVARAIVFIEANPDLDIGAADLARAAHVSVRAVQLAFRRHLDTTPLAYLRRVRLDRARAELLAGDPGDGTTVTRVAARWGYSNPSRFAAHYRAAHGEQPSDTLRAPNR